jgi:hypothetical protein
MLLHLLDHLNPRGRVENGGSLQAEYQRAQEHLSALWKVHGSHALLHHLNALFAYQPVLARPRARDGDLVVF